MSGEKPTTAIRGTLGEDLACSFLVKKGITILTRNFRVKGGEIDIIARHGNEIVFVEVKIRTSSSFGYPEESVTYQKLLRCSRAMRAYLMNHASFESYRFDVIAIQLDLLTRKASIHHIPRVEIPHWR